MSTLSLKRTTPRVEDLRSKKKASADTRPPKAAKPTPEEQAALDGARQRQAWVQAIQRAADSIRGFPVFQGDPVPLKIGIHRDRGPGPC
jgi:hypothetical protein